MDDIRLITSPANWDISDEEVVILINGKNLALHFEGLINGIPPEVAFFPSTHLLGKPHPWYHISGKPILYVCGNCGMTGCICVTVRITIGEDTVTWSDFDRLAGVGSRHKENYSDMAYVFQRTQYEKELSGQYKMSNKMLLDVLSW